MVPYLGDFKEDDTVLIVFNTFTSDDPSASCTITNFANTDVHIHKEDDLTQRNNAAGITVSIDFDGITGSHMIKIDTSDDTVAGFWVVAKDYFVRIEGTAIDGATINVFVGHFSIENRFKEVDLTHILGHLLTQTGTQLADGFQTFFDTANPTTMLAINLPNQTIDITGDITGNLSGSVGSVTGHTNQTGDSYAIVNNASYGNAKLVRSTSPANTLDVSATGEAGLDFNNIKDATGAYTLTNITVPTCITNSDMRGTDSAALASVLGALADVAADGNPTNADTVMQYAKQLINVLIGTVGIVAFPAEAAPANAVSLAEVIRAIHVDVTGLNGDVMRGTNGANTIIPDAAGTAPTKTEIVDEWETQAAADPTGFKVNIMEVNGTAQTANDNGADINSILGDTNELQTDWMNAGRLDAILDSILAMLDDARGEPGQGAPPVNPDAMTKLDYLYKSWRNKKTNDGTTRKIYNDAGAVVDQKSGLSEVAGTVTVGEMVSGP